MLTENSLGIKLYLIVYVDLKYVFPVNHDRYLDSIGSLMWLFDEDNQWFSKLDKGGDVKFTYRENEIVCVEEFFEDPHNPTQDEISMLKMTYPCYKGKCYV